VRARAPVHILYAAFVISLPIARPSVLEVGGTGVQLADLLLVATYGAWLWSWLRARRPIRRDGLLVCTLVYLAVLLVSCLTGELPLSRSLLKLAAYAMYLLLPVLSIDILAGEERLASVTKAWLVGGALAVAIGLTGIALFYIDRRIGGMFACSTYGLLPSGNYPRMCSTFRNPNMHVNYLTIVFAIGMACATLLVRRAYAWAALACCTLVALFTLSAGFAGCVLAGALIVLDWRRRNARPRSLFDTALIAGAAVACVFFALSMIAVLVPAGEGHLAIGQRDLRLWHGSRPAIWESAVQTFLQHPLLGKGYGTLVASSDDPAVVLSPDQIARLQGPMPRAWLEGHDVWLSVAGQAGILGLLAFIALAMCLGRLAWNARHRVLGGNARLALGSACWAAFCGAFLYHGLFGAFEESRHLWGFFGLLAAFAVHDPARRAADVSS
jgi:O-antigen ligase